MDDQNPCLNAYYKFSTSTCICQHEKLLKQNFVRPKFYSTEVEECACRLEYLLIKVELKN
jgi:hypothetical protein